MTLRTNLNFEDKPREQVPPIVMHGLNHRLNVLARDKIDAIRESAFIVLESTGFRFKHPTVLKMFDDFGCEVNYEKEIVKLYMPINPMWV